MKNYHKVLDNHNMLATIKSLLSPLLEDNTHIFLFGSRANGTANERSDYDIGLIGKEKIPFNTFLKIRSILDDMPIKIDVVDFGSNQVKNSFKEEALKFTFDL